MSEVKSKFQGVDGRYYIVNPAGAIHPVIYDHAFWRLKSAGWRLAQDTEIEAYNETKTQRHDRPICKPWSVESTIAEVSLPPDTTVLVDITDKALELAKNHGVALADIQGSGAGGRILVKDVEAAIDDA